MRLIHFQNKVMFRIFIFFCSLNLMAQTQFNLTEDQAREEAELAINYIKKSHPDQYWSNNKNIWDSYEKKLLERTGSISIGDQYFDLAYLFSLAMDTHTQIYPDKITPGFASVYPLRFRTFSDGLYIIAADKQYENLVGKKIVSFGGKPAVEFMNLLANYVSADHFERKKTLAEFLLIMPETYKYFGLSSENGVKFELEDLQGNPSLVWIKHMENKSFSKVFYEDPNSFGILVPDEWKTVYDVFDVKTPLTRRSLRKKYWHTTILDEQGQQVEFIQINKNENEQEGEQQFDFILSVFQEIRKKDSLVDRIIIDLRYNLGGWIKNTAALPGLLYGSDFYKPGKTIVLIGRETVSAGTILAADIEQHNYAFYIGEATGSKPNMFLEHKQVDLPYSKFYAESATDVYIVTNQNDTRSFIAPDYTINEKFSDFISGEDIALKKALEVTPDEVRHSQNGLYRDELWQRPSQKIALKNNSVELKEVQN